MLSIILQYAGSRTLLLPTIAFYFNFGQPKKGKII